MATVIVADETGLIKRVRLRDSQVMARMGHQAKGRSIHCMAWAGLQSADSNSHDESWRTREQEIAVGFKSGLVELYDARTLEMSASFDATALSAASPAPASATSTAAAQPIPPGLRAPKSLNAPSQLSGLAVLQGKSAGVDAVQPDQRRLLTCTHSGIVQLTPFRSLTPAEGVKMEEDNEDQMADAPTTTHKQNGTQKESKKRRNGGASPALAPAPTPATAATSSSPSRPASYTSYPDGGCSWSIGSNVSVLKVEPVSQSLFACGGKEHMLELWDLDSSRSLWKEKNVAHDMLNLRQQVWITDLAFVPNTQGRELVTGTAWHQLRSYDSRAQRKALYSVELSDHAITCVDVSPDGRYVVLGDGGGRLQQRDRRMNGRMVHVYHGIGGSVRGIQMHQSEPMIAAAGLDRFMRVYDVNTRKQLNKVYLKQKLNAVLFSTQTKEQAKADEEPERAADDEEEDGDEVWNELNKRKVKQEEGEDDSAPSMTVSSSKKRKGDRSGGDGHGKKIKVKTEPVGDADEHDDDDGQDDDDDDDDDDDVQVTSAPKSIQVRSSANSRSTTRTGAMPSTTVTSAARRLLSAPASNGMKGKGKIESNEEEGESEEEDDEEDDEGEEGDEDDESEQGEDDESEQDEKDEPEDEEMDEDEDENESGNEVDDSEEEASDEKPSSASPAPRRGTNGKTASRSSRSRLRK